MEPIPDKMGYSYPANFQIKWDIPYLADGIYKMN